MTCFPHI